MKRPRRLNILNPKSKYAMQGRGVIGNFYATPQDPDPVAFQDMGNALKVAVVSLSPKAVCIPYPYNKPIVAANPDSKLFREIVRRAGQRDTGCAFGFEVLLRTAHEELVFFCGTNQLRNLLPEFRACINRRIILSTLLFQLKHWQWYTAEIFVPFRDTNGFKPEPSYNDYDDTLD